MIWVRILLVYTMCQRFVLQFVSQSLCLYANPGDSLPYMSRVVEQEPVKTIINARYYLSSIAQRMYMS